MEKESKKYSCPHFPAWSFLSVSARLPSRLFPLNDSLIDFVLLRFQSKGKISVEDAAGEKGSQ
jgi:hypothetical protein